MAFDHGAFDDDDEHDERDDPDRHHDPEEESPASAPAPPPRKRWATERDEPVTNLARARNILDVELAEGVAPAGDDDVDSHAASVATRIGAGKSRAVDYCDVGIMFRRMPRIRDLCRSGAFPLWHLTKMAAAVVAVSDDDIAEVESTFLDYLHPRRDFQALPGIRVFMRELRRMVESVEPIVTPPDEDDPKPITGESYSVDNEYPGEYGELRAILRKDRLAEFDATVRAIRDSKIKAGEDCSLGDALMAMCRGDFAGAKVTMNIYVDGDASRCGSMAPAGCRSTSAGNGSPAPTPSGSPPTRGPTGTCPRTRKRRGSAAAMAGAASPGAMCPRTSARSITSSTSTRRIRWE